MRAAVIVGCPPACPVINRGDDTVEHGAAMELTGRYVYSAGRAQLLFCRLGNLILGICDDLEKGYAVGYKFSLVLSREITDEESAVLQEMNCSPAIFGSDSLPTNAEVTVTKMDFDDTSSPSLAEAIESALEAVKNVPDLTVPGLTVPAQPAGPLDEEPTVVAGEVITEEIAAEVAAEVAEEKPAVAKATATKATPRKPSTRKPASRKTAEISASD